MKLNKYSIIIGFLLILTLLTVIPGLAQDYTIDFDIPFMEDIEIYIEIINTVLALVAVYFAFQLSRKVKGSPQGSGWLMILIATVAFILLELYGLLGVLGIFHFSGLGDILEFFVVIFFIGGFLSILKAFSD
jgi:hypothetical protein